MIRTALVRDINTKDLHVIVADWYRSQTHMASDLRWNNFRVLKVWNGDKPVLEIEDWISLHRK